MTQGRWGAKSKLNGYKKVKCIKLKSGHDMHQKNNQPELLAPAGNLLSAIVALDSGADAVYVGLEKFNARERAENFTTTDASKLINYAHSNGKKVYITLNFT